MSKLDEMSTYQKVVLAKRPTDDIIPGETFRLERASAPKASDLRDGEVLLEARYLSLDPAMRGWLRGKSALNRAELDPLSDMCHDGS